MLARSWGQDRLDTMARLMLAHSWTQHVLDSRVRSMFAQPWTPVSRVEPNDYRKLPHEMMVNLAKTPMDLHQE